MTYGVLPALFIVSVVREPLHDEPVDAAECEPLPGGAADGHRYQRYVGIGRFLWTRLRGPQRCREVERRMRQPPIQGLLVQVIQMKGVKRRGVQVEHFYTFFKWSKQVSSFLMLGLIRGCSRI